MSPYFTDGSNLRRKAKKRLHNGEAQVRRWWSDKYKLPPNHDLFETQTMGELLTEMYEDFFVQKEELESELAAIQRDNDDGLGDVERQREIMASLRRLDRILKGEKLDKETKSMKVLDLDDGYSDPVIDKWEQELLDGKTPDLEDLSH